MYKVFINEKSILLSHHPKVTKDNIPFDGQPSLDKALAILEKTPATEVGLYSSDVEQLWKAFQKLFKVVEAAGGLVENHKGETLLIYRLGKWDLPKGKLEKNEGIEAAAVREVEEETGVGHLEITHFIQETYHLYNGKKGKKNLKKTYWYAMKHHGNDTPVPQTEEGISKVEWLPKKQVLESIFPQTFKNIQIVLNAYFK
ncbi:NUDIX hydrolase [Riemerella columbina]|uniref:NUDIX hydrolase n=1 Tax=Riemerella columbina TaxID=103810 RepID=UPI00037496A2|nr:NUDIX domain-containing protein [Riemerella columbina]